jgi:hypothetical protein
MDTELLIGTVILALIVYLYLTRNSSNKELHNENDMSDLKTNLNSMNSRISNLEKMIKMETTNTARDRKHVHDTLALQSEQRRFDNIQLSGIIDRHAGLSGVTVPSAH